MADNSGKSYVVTAQVCIIDTDSRQALYVHRGAPVPSNADPEQVAILLERGMIAEAEHVGGLPPTLPGDNSAEFKPAKAPAKSGDAAS